MKRISALCLFGLAISLSGCGGSSEPSNIMEGLDESAVQSYDEMVAADEARMNSDPGDAEGD